MSWADDATEQELNTSGYYAGPPNTAPAWTLPTNKPAPIWTMKNGTKIKVSDMETSHIQNCIKMLERALSNIPDPYQYGEPEGEMAMDAFNSGVREIEARRDALIHNIRVFNKELDWRKK